jgi:hypothetical protein
MIVKTASENEMDELNPFWIHSVYWINQSINQSINQ